ncbi:hypothetical protein M9Y10_010691 [Tritrichomonas musculus]|uniref:Serine-threonine/tyrosine-protein kinase catalytic domain-containing protein n=1 Tax=Tritrichomonas musculus TaxID=1915356 RepID=A0ABR2IMS4_9EUKA
MNRTPLILPLKFDSVSSACLNLMSKCLSNDPNDRPSFEEILIFLRENNFLLAADVNTSIVSKRDLELISVD